MAKTLLGVDEVSLAEATRALGTATDTETVNAALRLVVAQSGARRERALADLQSIADEGGFDFELLPKVDQ